MRAWVITVVVGAAALSACGEDKAAEPEPAPEPVINPLARVLEGDARLALLAQEGTTGLTLRFAAGNPQVDALAVGDLIVSEPAPAARFGLLRRVVSIDTSSGDVVIETTQAALQEAIYSGSFDVGQELEEVDLAEIVDEQDPTRGITVPIPLGFVVYDADNNPGTTHDQIRFDGAANFTAGWRLAFGVSFDPSELIDDLNPFDSIDPSLVAEVGVGEDIAAIVHIGNIGAADKEVKLPAHTFSPFVFYVGIPVVVTPRATVVIGTRGNIAGRSMTLGAHQWFNTKVGVRCDEDGCRPTNDWNHGFEAFGPDLTPGLPGYSANVDAYVHVRLELLVYGAVGPYGALEPYGRLIVQHPGTPAWRIRGGIRGEVGISSILGFSYGAEVFNESWAIAESVNSAPVAWFSSPKEGAKVQLNTPTKLWLNRQDLEDGFNCCTATVTSALDGSLGAISNSGQLDFTFTVPGVRVLTATVTDDDGATTTTSVTFSVENTPPDATIALPTTGSTRYRGVPILLRGLAVDGNEPGGTLPCTSLVWSGGGAGDQFPINQCNASAEGVTGAVISSNGQRTISFTATDTFGAFDTASTTVTIVDPPADIPTELAVVSPDPSGITINAFTPSLDLHFRAFDADDDSLNYNWQVAWNCNDALTQCTDSSNITFGTVTGASSYDPGGAVPPGVEQYLSWSLWSTMPPPVCGGSYRGRLEITVTGATTGVGRVIPLLLTSSPC